jgi:hypothetical protein
MIIPEKEETRDKYFDEEICSPGMLSLARR